MPDIKNIAEVKQFFLYLFKDRNVIFHPDESFNTYINYKTENRTFTNEKCQKFDILMSKCFAICEDNGADIYETASEVLNAAHV